MKKQRITRAVDIVYYKDVMVCVFLFLDKLSLYNTMQTNKLFKSISLLQALWSTMTIKKISFQRCLERVGVFRPSSIVLSNIKSCISAPQWARLMNLNSVREVTLINVTLDTRSVRYKKTSSLKKLFLRHCKKTCLLSRDFFKNACCELTTFHVESECYKSRILRPLCGYLSDHCPKLENLSIKDFPDIRFNQPQYITPFKCLRFLSVDVDSDFTDRSLQTVAHNSSELCFLSIKNCHTLTTVAFEAFESHECLKELRLIRCRRVVGGFKLQNVHTLTIDNCYDFSQPLYLSNLQTLIFNELPSMPSTAVNMTLSHNPNITYLQLSGCRMLDSFDTLYFPQLTHLDLTRTSKTPHNVLSKLKCKETLISLSLDGCTQINNQSMETIASHANLTSLHLGKQICIRLPYLQKISLLKRLRIFSFTNGYSSMDGDRVFVMRALAPTLQTLALPDCRRIDNSTIVTLKWFPNLLNINVRNTNVDDFILRELRSCCPHVQTLNVSGCMFLTENCMDVFPKQLQILFIDNVYAITDTTLKRLTHHDRLALRFISLMWCSQVSEEGVLAVVNKNSRIEMNLKGTHCKKKFQRDLVQNVDVVI